MWGRGHDKAVSERNALDSGMCRRYHLFESKQNGDGYRRGSPLNTKRSWFRGVRGGPRGRARRRKLKKRPEKKLS